MRHADTKTRRKSQGGPKAQPVPSLWVSRRAISAKRTHRASPPPAPRQFPIIPDFLQMHEDAYPICPTFSRRPSDVPNSSTALHAPQFCKTNPPRPGSMASLAPWRFAFPPPAQNPQNEAKCHPVSPAKARQTLPNCSKAPHHPFAQNKPSLPATGYPSLPSAARNAIQRLPGSNEQLSIRHPRRRVDPLAQIVGRQQLPTRGVGREDEGFALLAGGVQAARR
jgi:hypothetical protein